MMACQSNAIALPDNWEFDRSVLEQAAAELHVLDSWVFWWD